MSEIARNSPNVCKKSLADDSLFFGNINRRALFGLCCFTFLSRRLFLYASVYVLVFVLCCVVCCVVFVCVRERERVSV